MSDFEIRAEIGTGRLVFEPPVLDERIGVAVDLTLHNVFWRATIPTGEGIDVTVEPSADPYRYMTEESAQQVVLQPGDFILGETAEGVSLPHHLCGLIEGKSGAARHGLIVHCTAPKIDPGWGTPRPKRITLEMANLGKVPIKLRAGVPIAQLLLLRLGLPSTRGYGGKHGSKGT
jgi:deoxycytidine triphosphate deaminase